MGDAIGIGDGVVAITALDGVRTVRLQNLIIA
jgi:hypothetical protein